MLGAIVETGQIVPQGAANASRLIAIVEEIIEDKIEGELKPRILEQVRTMVNNLVSSLPANLKLYRIVTQQDAISITVCPVGDHLPHVVIGTPIERLPVLREGLTP